MNEKIIIALIGVITLQGGALVWLIKKKNGNGHPTGAQVGLVNEIKTHIDAMERRRAEDLKDTRHHLVDKLSEVQAALIIEYREWGKK